MEMFYARGQFEEDLDHEFLDRLPVTFLLLSRPSHYGWWTENDRQQERSPSSNHSSKSTCEQRMARFVK